ncbi:MAG: SusC/RagA family TonB-linked outer membrane protein [Mangrovibacterium sp.]
MRVISFLILVGTLTVSASSYSQQVKIDLRLKDSSIEDILLSIENNSRYIFIYDAAIIRSLGNKSIDVNSQSLETILDYLFDGSNVAYKIDDRQVFLFQKDDKKTLDSFRSKLLNSQVLQEVRGVVKDANGLPIPGVTVIVKGTSQGTVTGVNGNYSLSNVPGDATLVFSFVGLKTKEVPVRNQMSIDMIMEEETFGIEEVVAVGYGVQKKSDITGAVASYNTKQLERMPQTNIAQALQGKIAGMAVTSTSSAAEDAGTSILIRGSNSISASNSPLVILDGIPYGQPLSEINPNDIESIEVLKDASSAAIYGARAANGVILVTSKKGQKGKAIVKMDSYYGIDQIAKSARYFTADEYWNAIYEREGMADLPTAEEEANREAGKSTDWQKLATRNGVRQQHNISVSGASEMLSYYLSGAWSNTKGITRGDDFSRTTFRINMEGKVTNWLTIGTNTQLARINRDGVPAEYHFSSSTNAPSPYTLAYNEDGSLKIFPEPKNFGQSMYGNILDPILYDNYDVTRLVVTNNYLVIDFPFIPGLSYRVNTGYTYRNRLTETYRPSTSAGGYADKGRGDVGNWDSEEWIVDNIVTYNKSFGKHNIFVTGLYSAQQKVDITHSKRGRGLPNDFQGVYGIGTALTITSTEAYVKSSFLSQMGRINYNFDSRYLFTATIRRDGFSGFGPQNKIGIFPSVALGWNLSEENFTRELEWLSRAKLRLSYGVNGNQAINSYETMAALRNIWYPRRRKIIKYRLLSICAGRSYFRLGNYNFA